MMLMAADTLLKERDPAAIWCCDPVMGDVGRGFFVRDDVPPMFREQILPRTQVLTPNHFELDHLVGRPSRTLAEVLVAVDELRDRGPGTVLVTSMVTDETDPATVQMLAVDDTGAYLVTTPRLEAYFTGSGDVTSALFPCPPAGDRLGAQRGGEHRGLDVRPARPHRAARPPGTGAGACPEGVRLPHHHVRGRQDRLMDERRERVGRHLPVTSGCAY